ncbi:MAG: hypothetical protein RLZ25_1056 [Pseudomonadota bacterium]|jgi:hypothetical protein
MNKEIADNIRRLANAITPIDSIPGEDASGGSVSSLTEAVMGVTSALVMIADSIDNYSKVIEQTRNEENA